MIPKDKLTMSQKKIKLPLNIKKYLYFVIVSIIISLIIPIFLSYYLEPNNSTPLKFIGMFLFAFFLSGFLPTLTLISCIFRKSPVKQNIVDKIMFYLGTVGLAVIILGVANNTYQHSNSYVVSQLNILSKNINKTLPRNLGSTILMKTSVTENSFNYIYKLNVNEDEFKSSKKINKLHKTVMKQYCTYMKNMKENGYPGIYPDYPLKYIYLDSKGNEIAEITGNPKDCKNKL